MGKLHQFDRDLYLATYCFYAYGEPLLTMILQIQELNKITRNKKKETVHIKFSPYQALRHVSKEMEIICTLLKYNFYVTY